MLFFVQVLADIAFVNQKKELFHEFLRKKQPSGDACRNVVEK